MYEAPKVTSIGSFAELTETTYTKGGAGHDTIKIGNVVIETGPGTLQVS